MATVVALVVGLLLGTVWTSNTTGSAAEAQPSPLAPHHVQADIPSGTFVSGTWWDAAGQRHHADNWTRIRVTAVGVVVAVMSDDSSAECALTVDGRKVDDQTAAAGQMALCSWFAAVNQSPAA